MLADLHTHTTASDGCLSPAAVVARAVEAGVELLAITDHDTFDAWPQACAARPDGLTLVPGIEFSTTWKGHGVHLVGLNFTPGSAAMNAALAHQSQARGVRAERIAERLHKQGLPDALAGAAALANNGAIGRPHFAAWLVSIGAANTIDQAFKKYLGANRSSALHDGWAALPTIVEWIRDAGGTAVLAHPAKYRLTRTQLHELTAAFQAAGGHALEVVSGLQRPDVTRDLAALAARYQLRAGIGSDFHQPGQSWAALGRLAALPADCTPVWEGW